MRAYGRFKKGERIMIRKIIKIDEEKCNAAEPVRLLAMKVR